jgi:Fe-S cluster assembly protein SufD
MTTFIDLTKEKKEHLVFDKKDEYVVFLHNISGKFRFELREKCEVHIFGIFTGKNSDEFHIETVQHHNAIGSFSNLFIKGVFEDSSKLHYQGLIRIEPEGQQSHAYQKNQNLVLSSGVFVESNPFLEILANDVFCTHGSTTGKLNEDDLFYVQSRGLDTDEARDLLVQGFIDEIVYAVQEKVPDFTFQASV